MTELNPDDLEVTVFRPTYGGLSINDMSDAVVKVKHLPTGITVECSSERSQLQNKVKCLEELRSILL